MDARTRDHLGAEHLVHLLDSVLPVTTPGYVASTHLVTGDDPHTAVSASWPSTHSPDPVVDELLDAVSGHLHLGEVGIVVHDEAGAASRGPEDLVTGALRASGEHRARTAGRLARFDGRAEVERVCSVADVLALSAIDAVEALAGTDVQSSTVLDLTEWARPTWRQGRAVLLVQPGRDGLVPFESRHQIPCCSDH